MRQIDIISVSNSSEKLMLSMVSKLRRLLRNVLRTTKLLNVITQPDLNHISQPMWRNPSTMFTCDAVYDGMSELTKPTNPDTNKATAHMPSVSFKL